MTARLEQAFQKPMIVLLAALWSVLPLRAQEPDRSKLPVLGPPPVLRLPPIQRFKLLNGLPVVLMEKHEVPLVQVNMLVNAGSAFDAAGQNGLATLTLDMMEEGAGARDALQLADAIDFLGAQLSTFARDHVSGVSLRTPLSKLDSALSLMADIALRPTFPAKELERLRKERLTTLLQWHDQPRTIASVLVSRTLFGTNHPYGVTRIGTEQTIRSFSTADLRTFYETYVNPKNSTLIVVGDVTTATIKPRLERLFGTWKARGTPAAAVWPTAEQVSKREILLVDKPGAAQSVIRLGRIGAPRMTDDYYPIVVMNTILGGSFTSRLNNNLRETNGYTYGAGSVFDFRELPGPFTAYADVQTSVTDKALVEFMKELNGILQQVSNEELTKAKNYVALSYPGEFQSVSEIAGKLGELVTFRLPDNYFNDYIDKILLVTKEDVQRVARKYIDPEKLAIVIVGDTKVVEKGIDSLKLGPTRTLTIVDVLGKKPMIEGSK